MISALIVDEEDVIDELELSPETSHSWLRSRGHHASSSKAIIGISQPMDGFSGLGFNIINQLHLYVDDCINRLCGHLNSWIDEIYE